MADFDTIVTQLESSSTPTRLEGAERLKAILQDAGGSGYPDQSHVKDLMDAANNMAKSHNTKVCMGGLMGEMRGLHALRVCVPALLCPCLRRRAEKNRLLVLVSAVEYRRA